MHLAHEGLACLVVLRLAVEAPELQAYLDMFSDDVYAELPDFKLDNLNQKAQRALARAEAAKVTALAPKLVSKPRGEIAFNLLLTTIMDKLAGKSIEELIGLSPLSLQLRDRQKICGRISSVQIAMAVLKPFLIRTKFISQPTISVHCQKYMHLVVNLNKNPHNRALTGWK